MFGKRLDGAGESSDVCDLVIAYCGVGLVRVDGRVLVMMSTASRLQNVEAVDALAVAAVFKAILACPASFTAASAPEVSVPQRVPEQRHGASSTLDARDPSTMTRAELQIQHDRELRRFHELQERLAAVEARNALARSALC